ncbi:hypothetical protein P9302_16090 [Brevibacillus agri]|uniref:hypothetical protein n=1 Tax=Brevibacillus agri TaxID=51101 RepID=UPI002E1B5AC4|nr:hypothetical protein [Brevibacillus agri]
MILSANKLQDWLLQHAGDDSHPEVIRFVKNLLIEMEFGAFDYDGDIEESDPYA